MEDKKALQPEELEEVSGGKRQCTDLIKGVGIIAAAPFIAADRDGSPNPNPTREDID